MVNVKVQYGGDGGDLVKWFRGKVDRIENGNEVIIRNAMHEGAELAKEYIATRGTGRVWQGDWSRFPNATPGRTGSIPGRSATGYMMDSITSEVTSFGKGKIQGAFGWINRREDYFAYQEGGFQHAITGEFIEGMYAMYDAAAWTLDQLEKDIRENLKNA